MMAADDMLSWLKATIEGDKAAAEAAAAPRKGRYVVADEHGTRFDYTPRAYNGEWVLSEDGKAVMPVCAEADAVVSGSCGCCCPSSQGQKADLAHIALHDPRDTIARSDAELALLDEHPAAAGTYLPDWAGRCQGCGERMPCTTVKLLASGRRHRAGFNPEWVPSERPDSPEIPGLTR